MGTEIYLFILLALAGWVFALITRIRMHKFYYDDYHGGKLTFLLVASVILPLAIITVPIAVIISIKVIVDEHRDIMQTMQIMEGPKCIHCGRKIEEGSMVIEARGKHIHRSCFDNNSSRYTWMVY
ncbi:MAG: hypothetical protein FWH17_05115 [Oscillospiraceae bacterium]|nr:hypothetical protein [Oscillospiraceae bacterium]